VTGTDGIGDSWEPKNGPLLINSNFGMSDAVATPQPFNSLNFSNGLGDWATSFQMTLNNSQFGVGFKGIIQTPVASGQVNHMTVKPDLTDSSTWVAWDITYNLLDATTSLYQQILFTAPTGTRLDQGVNFDLDVNFAGIMTNDSGWAASWDDRFRAGNDVPEPGSMSLLGLGLLGLMAAYRRKQT
jgi:hypothetical protein